jgi:hypothetical protein
MAIVEIWWEGEAEGQRGDGVSDGRWQWGARWGT